MERRRGSSQESLTGGDLDNDKHSLSVSSVANSDDRAMMQLQRVSSTTTVMMAVTADSTPGDSKSDIGILDSATTFASDVRRFSAPDQRPPHQQLQVQFNNHGGSSEHHIHNPTSSLSLLQQQQHNNSYHSECAQESNANSLIHHQGVIRQSASSAGIENYFSVKV